MTVVLLDVYYEAGIAEIYRSQMQPRPDGSTVALTYQQRACSSACLTSGDGCHTCVDKFEPSPTQHPLITKVRESVIECVQRCRFEKRGCRACVEELQTGPDGRPARFSQEQVACSKRCLEMGIECEECVGKIAGVLFD